MKFVFLLLPSLFGFIIGLTMNLSSVFADDSAKLSSLEAPNRSAETWLPYVELSVVAYKSLNNIIFRKEEGLAYERSRNYFLRSNQKISQLEEAIAMFKPDLEKARSEVTKEACKFELPCAYQRSLREQGSFEKFPHLAKLCRYLTANLQEAFRCEGRWTTHHTVGN